MIIIPRTLRLLPMEISSQVLYIYEKLVPTFRQHSKIDSKKQDSIWIVMDDIRILLLRQELCMLLIFRWNHSMFQEFEFSRVMEKFNDIR